MQPPRPRPPKPPRPPQARAIAPRRAAALDRAEDRRTGAAPAATDATPRKKRRYARKHYRRYAYWEPFPVYWPNYYRHRLNWRRVAWFSWF